MKIIGVLADGREVETVRGMVIRAEDFNGIKAILKKEREKQNERHSIPSAVDHHVIRDRVGWLHRAGR